ncbi:helicase-related protein [Olivibacter jilunii]|uniref:helicase-related protein n=1 Tax=Olivibacter jilunii TaxID=985016 RepID=UPI00103168AD|nr:helicase-related protein [Olivibacter jilunii]
MGFSAFFTLKNNVDAIRIALRQQEGQAFSDEELESLRQYRGFGGIPAIHYGIGDRQSWIDQGATSGDLRLHENVQELYQLIQDNFSPEENKLIVDSLRNSVLTSFYTPDFFPEAVFRAIREQGIEPKSFYDPSAGSGVFVEKALAEFPELQRVTAVEKDYLTGMILTCLSSSNRVDTKVHIGPFEETDRSENGTYDLISSNIPFGSFLVDDPDYPDKKISGRIHSYFFAKGLDKLADGGLLVYLTTDTFLNRPGNEFARRYVFERADFVSLAVLPENLMQDTGGTEAPSQLLILQKHVGKKGLSPEEELLVKSITQMNEFGEFTVNAYVAENPRLLLGNIIEAGKNQYGRPQTVVRQSGEISGIALGLAEILKGDIDQRFDFEKFQGVKLVKSARESRSGDSFEYLEMPVKQDAPSGAQLGLFDTIAPELTNRAIDYIKEADERMILRKSAKLLGIIRTAERPDHESIVLLTARHRRWNRYMYQMVSNVNGPSYSIGWMSAKSFNVALKDLGAELKRFPYTFLFEGDKSLEHYVELAKDRNNFVSPIEPYYRNGTLVIHQGKAGLLEEVDHEAGHASFKKLQLKNETPGLYAGYTALRHAFLELSEVEGKDLSAVESLRESLRHRYETFTAAFGLLNSKKNSSLLLQDEAYGLMVLSSLERRQGEEYVPADILYTAVKGVEERILVDEPQEALGICLNRHGKVRLDVITELCQQPQEEVIEALEHKIFINPINGHWETRDQFLSGNVVDKLDLVERIAAEHPDNLYYEKSLKALKGVQPMKIPFELLEFNFGQRWMPVKYFERYGKELFETEVKVDYLESMDAYGVQIPRRNEVTDRDFMIVPKSGSNMLAHALFKHALENTAPYFTYTVKNGDVSVRLPDTEATQLAHEKVERIRSGFGEWLRRLPDEEKRYLENYYNRLFNCYTLREYDGSHQTFPGLDWEGLKRIGIHKIHQSQSDGVWRIVQNNGALIDHAVGLGKTLIMILAAQELKRLGICKKPMIAALNANASEIAKIYKTAYPSARIMVPGEKDFEKKNRQRLFFEIKNNNVDCIIVTHDQFIKIQQSPKIQMQIFQAELDAIEKDLNDLKGRGDEITKSMRKGMEIRKSNLLVRLTSAKRSMDSRRDKDVFFEDMGIDHLFVDESHGFKNLLFTTRHNRVSGLGNQEGSQKALNMLFALRTLQERRNSDMCATFLSGTPISNSLTEMFLIFKYLTPRELERQHIQNFDAWAAIFAKKSVDYEFSVTNQIIAKERFRHFVNVPELAVSYNRITDYKTADHIKLDKPALEEYLINIKPNADQEVFTQRLVQFAKTGNAQLIGKERLTPNEEKSRMLLATNLAKKMAVDMRLINPYKYGDDPNNKINTCARKAYQHYIEFMEHKGTQIIFCDVGTPGTKGFNMYEAMRDALIKQGVPSEEITFIHDWPRDEREKLFEKMNEGKIRFLLGSTGKAGTALNVQKRVIAMHHLDIPWKPSELDQRNGRGSRPKNEIAKLYKGNKVYNYIYATEKSLDNYKFNLLKVKQLFISQLKSNKLYTRTLDEGAFDEESGMNYAEYIAVLSGDTSLLEKSKLEKKVALLESLKMAHYNEQRRNTWEFGDLERKYAGNKRVLDLIRVDEQEYSSRLQWKDTGQKLNPIQLDGFTGKDSEAIGNFLIQLHKTYRPKEADEKKKIGTLYGFDLFLSQKKVDIFEENRMETKPVNFFYAQRDGGEIKYTYNGGQPMANPKLTARLFLHAIDRCIDLKENYERDDRSLADKIENMKRFVHKPFDREEELARLKVDLDNLSRQILINIQDKERKEAEEITNPDKVDMKPVIADVMLDDGKVIALNSRNISGDSGKKGMRV